MGSGAESVQGAIGLQRKHLHPARGWGVGRSSLLGGQKAEVRVLICAGNRGSHGGRQG